MKERYVADLKPEEEVLEFFLVKSIAIKVGANKKQYLDLLLADSSGEVTAKKWDVAEPEVVSLNAIKEGDVVKVKALVTEWNGTKQLRVAKLRKTVEQDEISLMDFVKAAPEPPEDMYRYILDKAASMADEDLKKLCTKLLTENEERLLYYPAAAKNHHAELAGLLYHMKRMLQMGEKACEVYTNLKKDWVLAGVILHDIEKLNEIEANNLGIASGYSFEGQFLGHIVQGVITIDRECREMGISREKAIMLEHMVLAHHYEPEFGSPKKPLFPEAEMLHYLDIVDARMYDMEHALSGVQPGEFSDRVWTLDNRKIYRPVEEQGEE